VLCLLLFFNNNLEGQEAPYSSLNKKPGANTKKDSPKEKLKAKN